MKLTGSNIIAGEYSSEGARTFTNVNPRTRTPGEIAFHEATPGEVDRAVTAAARAFDEIRNYSQDRIAAFLDRCADEIDNLGDELLQTADWETGLGIPRLTGERGRTTGQLRKFGAVLREGSYVEAIIDPAQPDREPSPRADIRRMLFPIGPVGVFSASNFPFAFAVAGGDTASAFAAGCAVIVKGHPSHPATSELFAAALNRAVDAEGFPAGTFSLIQGAGTESGQALVKHPALEAVAFTGSLRAGRAIYDSAAARPKPIPVYAEMGSVNPVIVLPGALEARADSIAEGLANSVTLGSGQFCTNPGLVFLIEGDAASAFVDAVRARMEARTPTVLLNARIEQNLAQTVEATMHIAGVERVTGGEPVENGPFCYANTVMRTTGAAFREEEGLQVEHFGPVTLIVMCESEADLMAALESVHGNLTATLHAEPGDLEKAAPIADRMREKVGRLIWNGYPTGVEVGYAMQHGGPYPATTAPLTTSVGMAAIKRFLRPVAFQDVPEMLLPDALKDANPLGIWRLVDGKLTKDTIT